MDPCLLMLAISLFSQNSTSQKTASTVIFHKFVQISFPGNVLQILDPHLASRVEEATEGENIRNHTPNSEQCLISLVGIGLLSSGITKRKDEHSGCH